MARESKYCIPAQPQIKNSHAKESCELNTAEKKKIVTNVQESQIPLAELVFFNLRSIHFRSEGVIPRDLHF